MIFRVPHITPFDGCDIRTLVDSRAKLGSHVFLIWAPFSGGSKRWTYREFAMSVRSFASGLINRGVKTGDRVIIHLENCPESIIAWYGCGYAGAVAVNTNARASASELAYFAEHCQAVGAITQPRFAEMVASAGQSLSWLCTTETDNGDPPSVPSDFERFSTIAGDPDRIPDHPFDPWAPFAYQYTSGTTSYPKAVRWTHGNALWGARLSAMQQGLSWQDRHLVHLPLYHTNAQIYSVGAALWAGATAVIMPRFSASRFWQMSLDHRCTWTSMVPFCVRALETQVVPDRHHYRYWGNTSSSSAIDEYFKVESFGWWGMTETISQCIVSSPGISISPGAIGRASPAYGVHVLDGNMQPVRPGETGDLYIRGQPGVSLFLDYAGDALATASSFTDDGLLITGDRIRLGEDGSLFFADRAKDMLKIGGENVAASEIEQVILTVPGVVEVAVVAKPDAMLDEVPVAFVIATPADQNLADSIKARCAAQLASFKQPAEIRIVKALPRSTIEKIAKAELRAMLAQDAQKQ